MTPSVRVYESTAFRQQLILIMASTSPSSHREEWRLLFGMCNFFGRYLDDT
jgi:hypothetical protein